MPLIVLERLRTGCLFAVAFAAAFMASPALSGVAGTHHDMEFMTGVSEKGICSYCHIPHNAETEQGMLSRKGNTETLLGEIGSFCYTCHDGTVNPGALIEAPNGLVGIEVLTKSHGGMERNFGTVPSVGESEENLIRGGMYPIGKESGRPAASMDCRTCHDVHNNVYPPFLKAPLDHICQNCHSGSDFLGKGRWTKVEDVGERNCAHPIGQAVKDSGHDHKRELNPSLSFRRPHQLFDFPVYTGEQLANRNTHWSLGGHLLGEEKTVSCVTCHSAHMPSGNLLVSAASNDEDRVVCSGCHGTEQNPGNPGVTKYGHPVYEESLPPYEHNHANHTVGKDHPNLPDTGVMGLFVDIPNGYIVGDRQELLCMSCHVAHGGKQGKKLLYGANRSWAGGVICNECHGTGSYVQGNNWHHPVTPLDKTLTGFQKLLPWNTAPGLPGDLSDGLQCTDCHVELAKSAHNW